MAGRVGVPIRWARAGPADFTPLVAMVAAVLILRFFIGARLTAMTTALAVAGGALWAFGAERFGLSTSTFAALVLVAALRLSVRRRRLS